MKSYSSQFLRFKPILAIQVLILLSIVHLYHDSHNPLMMDLGAGGGSPLSASFPEESHYIESNAQSTSTSSSFKSFNEIANRTKQVIITMPAKASGSTLKEFAGKCSSAKLPDNIIRFKERIEMVVFKDNYKVPTIIASHSFSPGPLIDLVKGATRETLIIYSHRDELSRIRSAIQHVFRLHVCTKEYNFNVEVSRNRCVIDEENLIYIIKSKQHEIGVSAPKLLKCKVFDAIAQNDPSNLVFVHYKQADKLQKILAKYHCPHILKDLPIASNVASDKRLETFVRLSSDKSRVVTFEEWFDEKQNVILWALDLKKEMDCQSKVIDMEDHLFSCPDEAVTLIHGEYQCVSLSE